MVLGNRAVSCGRGIPVDPLLEQGLRHQSWRGGGRQPRHTAPCADVNLSNTVYQESIFSLLKWPFHGADTEAEIEGRTCYPRMTTNRGMRGECRSLPHAPRAKVNLSNTVYQESVLSPLKCPFRGGNTDEEIEGRTCFPTCPRIRECGGNAAASPHCSARESQLVQYSVPRILALSPKVSISWSKCSRRN